MHMGHSHSHNHAVQHGSSSSAISTSSSSSSTTKPVNAGKRRVALFLFSALAILGPPLVRKGRLAQPDVIAFALTSTTLALVETTIRREIKHVLTRIRQLGHGIRKHSTPLDTKFFFQNDNAADRVTLVGGIINVVLSVGKFAVGVACHSSALVADAGHSLSDLFSDFITLWAVQIGRLPPDDDHPYGHAKFEAIGSLFLALTLLGTGLSVGAVSNRKLIEILSSQQGTLASVVSTTPLPKFPALLMAAVSIFSKEWLFRITKNVGEKINSQVVIANAWHHRSDAYSSILALASIGMAMYIPGFLAADAAAGILVAAMICMTGAEIMGESIKQLTDTSSNEELVEKVTNIASQQEDVQEVTRVRARQVGSSAMIDVEVCMKDDLSSSAARAIEERLKAELLQQDGVMAAEVKAKSPGVVVCPALLKVASISQPTAAQVESCVREEILENHPDVKTVEGVTVYYQDTVLINVDVDIRVHPNVSIAKANALAEAIRDSLQVSSQINKASIFLDLNENSSAPTASVPTVAP